MIRTRIEQPSRDGTLIKVITVREVQLVPTIEGLDARSRDASDKGSRDNISMRCVKSFRSRLTGSGHRRHT